MPVRLHEGDCLDILRTLPDHSIHSIVTEPPADCTTPIGAIWAEALRVLRPGGHLLCSASTHTYHRVAIAIEDAGFEVRDQIGFAHDSAGRPCLAPAWVPVCVARKPLIGTVAANVLAHGCGAINVDACRVAASESTSRTQAVRSTFSTRENGPVLTTGGSDLGRWPANVLHDGSDEVEAAFAAFAETKSSLRKGYRNSRNADVYGKFSNSPSNPDNTYGDSGSVSRFFYCAKADANDADAASQRMFALLRYLMRLVTPTGGTVLDPFASSAITGHAAIYEGFDAILIGSQG